MSPSRSSSIVVPTAKNLLARGPQSGGYGCTIPTSHRFFSAIKYLVSPIPASAPTISWEPDSTRPHASAAGPAGLTVQVAAAEGQCAKVPVDDVEQLLRARKPQVHVSDIEILHVVRALQVFPHVALAGAAKGLNSKELALFHFGLLAALHNRD
eukprot:scaffold347_cov380-Prasinococcus_capsulatus_cf.AAC.5